MALDVLLLKSYLLGSTVDWVDWLIRVACRLLLDFEPISSHVVS